MLKFCNRCGKPTEYPEKYCDGCKGVAEAEKREHQRQYDQRRNPEHVQFYHSKAWKVLSARKLQDAHYRCEVCEEIACEVHHVATLEEDWGRRLEYENLKALCHRCHNKQHGRFGNERGRGG